MPTKAELEEQLSDQGEQVLRLERALEDSKSQLYTKEQELKGEIRNKVSLEKQLAKLNQSIRQHLVVVLNTSADPVGNWNTGQFVPDEETVEIRFLRFLENQTKT